MHTNNNAGNNMGGNMNTANAVTVSAPASGKKLFIIFIIGVIIGAGSVWMLMNDKMVSNGVENKDTEENIGDENTLSGTTVSSNNRISLGNQSAGDNVNIDSAVFAEVGWVVIREDNNGEQGNILGAQLFDVGEHSGVVTLLRGTQVGSVYHALLYSDNGDREFNTENDLPLSNTSGDYIQTEFTAQ